MHCDGVRPLLRVTNSFLDSGTDGRKTMLVPMGFGVIVLCGFEPLVAPIGGLATDLLQQLCLFAFGQGCEIAGKSNGLLQFVQGRQAGNECTDR